MDLVNTRSALILALAIGSCSSLAAVQETTLIGCSDRKATRAQLSLYLVAQTSMDASYQPTCPLLQQKKLRTLIGRFAAGTEFAYPSVPYTCLSAKGITGTFRFDTGRVLTIDPAASHSESAQRLLPVPSDQGGVGVFAASVDSTLQAGAAMTAIHLRGVDAKGKAEEVDLLLNDHFLISADGEDTEDFLIVGSQGKFKINGRLIGTGQIISQTPLGISFEVTGTVCIQ